MRSAILIVIACLFAGSSKAQQTYTGEFIRLSAHTEGFAQVPVFWLKTPPGYIYTLLFSNASTTSNIRTGDYGIVHGNLVTGNDLYINTINVTSYEIISLSETAYVDTLSTKAPTQARNLRSITFVLGVCNWPSLNTTRVSSNHARFTKYLQACTYNRYDFDLKTNIIVGPIQLPCKNRQYNFDAAFCGSNEIYGWAQYAENYARSVLGIAVDRYKHRLFMLPKGISCDWAGLGMLGCGDYCYTWFNGEYGLQPSVLLHEIGHNLGLMHSSTPSDEYGDGSCAMGRCCSQRCFNSPQAWVLGITEPLSTLNGTTMVPGISYSYRLPGHLSATRNFVKINVDWLAPATSYHISYRNNISFDSNLVATYMHKVLVHEFWKNRRFGMRTMLQGILPTMSSYELPRTGVVISFNTEINGQASVRLCRKTSATEICGDGIDNNCNGQVDENCEIATLSPVTRFALSVHMNQNKVNMTYIRNVMCPALASAIDRSAPSCSIMSSIGTYRYTITYSAPQQIQIRNTTDFTLRAKLPCGALILTNPPTPAWCAPTSQCTCNPP